MCNPETKPLLTSTPKNTNKKYVVDIENNNKSYETTSVDTRKENNSRPIDFVLKAWLGDKGPTSLK